MKDARQLKTSIFRIAMFGILPLFAACGGGGGGGSDTGGNNGGNTDSGPTITIFGPTVGGQTFTTDDESVALEGTTSFKLADVDCSAGGLGFVNYESTTQSVSIRNQANGDAATALPRVNCALPIQAKWVVSVGTIALEMGSNLITATVSGGNSSSITVIREPDTTPPTVVSESPADGSTGFPVSGTAVRVEFSDDMDAATISATTFTVEDTAGTPVPGTVTYFAPSKAALFRSNEPLAYLTTYTARVTTGVTDDGGNPLGAEFSWSFTTESNPDIRPPMQIAESPAANSICASQDGAVTAQFDEQIIVTTGTFTLEDSGGTPVAGAATFGNFTATFTPTLTLDSNETYMARLGGGIADLAGNTVTPSSWSFRTELAPEGSWVQIATPANVARRAGHRAVWTGSEMIVWGGFNWDGPFFPFFQLLTDNGRYDPALDQWSSVSTIDAPRKRLQHSATWTGTEMIIWGGVLDRCSDIGCLFSTATGGRYNPATDTWLPMSAVGAPSPRRFHTAIWTGTELIIWGGFGYDFRFPLSTGARYNPSTDMWSPLSNINAPAARSKHHAVFDGQQMIVWGGHTGQHISADGAIYDPVIDIWLALPTQNAPDPARSLLREASVVWTGADMLVWSPSDDFILLDPNTNEFTEVFLSETRRYSSVQNQWDTVVDACNPRATPNAAWLNGRLLSWSPDYAKGQSYDEQRDAWVPITSYPGTPAPGATVVVVGNSVIVWGGETDTQIYTNMGYRLSP